jgi:hypothetical protein
MNKWRTSSRGSISHLKSLSHPNPKWILAWNGLERSWERGNGAQRGVYFVGGSSLKKSGCRGINTQLPKIWLLGLWSRHVQKIRRGGRNFWGQAERRWKMSSEVLPGMYLPTLRLYLLTPQRKLAYSCVRVWKGVSHGLLVLKISTCDKLW